MKRFRQSLLTWTTLILLTGFANSFALSEEITISSAGDLNTAIARYNSTGESLVINLSGTITLTGELPIIKGNGENTLKIVGGTINGGGTCRGLIIDSGEGSITIEGTSFASCVAYGGDGGSGANGGGGGMGAGGAIYAKSGEITLKDVTLSGNAAIGGKGGNVLYQSTTYGGGGGLDGNGGSGTIGDSLTNPNGSAGNGGGLGMGSDGTATGQIAGAGGGEAYLATESRNQSAHYENGVTGIVGGDGGYGGGGAGSVYVGGDGGLGGGGGAGAQISGSGGFGAGGAGGSSATTAGLGGFAGGNGGYQPAETSTNFSETQGGGTGGGGAGLGGAVYVEKNAKVKVVYTTDSTIANNLVAGGAAGVVQATGSNGSASAGVGIGAGLFLKDNVTIDVAKDATLTVNNSLGGYGSLAVREGGIIKEGEGTLALNATSSYTGDTVVKQGTLAANALASISQYSKLKVNGSGNVQLGVDQSVLNLQGDSGATVDLGGKKLTITAGGLGSEMNEYAGTILSNGKEGTGGVLVKRGTGALYLTGDNSASDFATDLYGGTLRLKKGNSIGQGDITYYRTDITDTSKAIALEGAALLNNNINLYGNVGPMRIGTVEGSSENDVVELAGQIVAKSNSAGTIQVDMDSQSQALRLSNTGVLPTGTYSSNLENRFTGAIIKKGTLLVDSMKVGDLFYSALGEATVTNAGDDNSFQILSTEDDVYLKNNFELETGLLNIQNERVNQNLHYSGLFSGQGGINVDLVGENDILSMTGTLNYRGETKISNGILDISGLDGKTTGSVYLAGLASGTDSAPGNAALLVGSKSLQIGDANNHYYQGIITDSLTEPSVLGMTLSKVGTGNWTLSLDSGSNVSAIDVKAGTLTAEDNTLSTTAINLKDGGTFGVNGNIAHDLLDTSVKGSGLAISEGSSLNLLGSNATSRIASNLSGKGTLILSDRTDPDTEWSLSGANGLWSGTIRTADGSNVALNSSNAAGNTEASIILGKDANLAIGESQGIGHLVLNGNTNLNFTSGKTFTIHSLSHQSETTPGTLNSLGGGMIVLNKGAAKSYYGTTNIESGVLKVIGDNTTTDGVSRGLLTLDNSTLIMDYSDVAVGDNNVAFGSLWGDDDIKVAQDGGGINVAGAKKEVVLTNNIIFDNTDSNIPEIQFTSKIDKLSFVGDFTGNGNLNKLGTGTLALNGTSLLEGKTFIKEGTLQLGDGETANEQLKNSDIVVYSGANLTGLANNLGTLSVLGNVDLVSNGVIQLNAASGSNAFAMYSGGLVNLYMKDADEYTKYQTADGNMTFAGGTINVTVDDDYKSEVKAGTTLKSFQTENGVVSGNYSNLLLTDNVQGLRLKAVASDKGLDLVFGRLRYTDNAQTANAMALGQYLDKAAEIYGTDYQYLFNVIENEIESNHSIQEEMTGSFQLSAVNAQLMGRNMLRQTVTQNVVPMRDNSRLSEYRGQVRSSSSVSGWMNVFGTTGSATTSLVRNNFDYDMLGGVFGLEAGTDDAVKAGLFYSYSHSKIAGDSILDSVKMDENVFGAYLRWEDRLGYGMVYGNLGLASYEGHRFASLPYTYDFSNEHDGWNSSIYLERGFTVNMNRLSLQPYFGLQYSYFDEDGYQEQNGHFQAASLTRDSISYNSLQTIVGNRVHFNTCFLRRDTNVYLHTSWLHELLDEHADSATYITALPGAGSYQVIGSGLGRDWFLCGLGGQMKMNEQFHLFGSADYQLNDYVSFISGNAGFRYLW